MGHDENGQTGGQAMPEVKRVKEPLIAGQATQTPFDFFIQWHLTERCNLRCRHCYQDGNRVQEMTPDEVRKEIEGAIEMFQAWGEGYGISVSPSIHFTGGEPFLFTELWTVVAHARECGCRVAVMTNGTRITEKDAEIASSLGVDEIQVSLEGPSDIHESIRGKGSFRAAARGVEELLRAGVHVNANVTLSRLNVSRIEETIEAARSMGFSAVGFSRVVPCGEGKALLENLLSPGEVRSTYERILSLDSPGLRIRSGDPLAGLSLPSEPPSGSEITLSGCSAGFSGVTIASDGSVMPCRRIGLAAGNLKQDSLRRIWASSKILWRLRSKKSYKGKCGRCPFWPSCRGCRAVAYAYSAAQGRPDLFADDPQCWMSTAEASGAS